MSDQFLNANFVIVNNSSVTFTNKLVILIYENISDNFATEMD